MVLVALTLLASTAHAQEAPAEPPRTPGTPPTEADLEIAKAHFRTGQIDYEQSRYPEAAREFETAFRLSGKVELLYNVGKAYAGAGDLARALAAYRRWLAAAPAAPDRDAVAARVVELAHTVGRLRLRDTAAGANVKIDAEPVGETPLPAPLELNPGKHRLEVAKEGFRTFRTYFDVSADKETTVAAPLESLMVVRVVEVERKPPEKKPLYKQWWLWTIVGGVVVAGAVTGGVLGAQPASISGPSTQIPQVR